MGNCAERKINNSLQTGKIDMKEHNSFRNSLIASSMILDGRERKSNIKKKENKGKENGKSGQNCQLC